jgi:hypothetical protein
MSNGDTNSGDDSARTANVLQSHFWITAAAFGANGFLISGPFDKEYHFVLLVISSTLSFIAAFQIIELAGSSDVPSPPVVGLDDRPYMRKFRETVCNFRLSPLRFWFILCEFKGALFYWALVFTSCVGVWAKYCP